MKIKIETEDKKRFLDLLLMADEQENMIDRYLPYGDMYVGYDADTPVAVCVMAICGEDVDGHESYPPQWKQAQDAPDAAHIAVIKNIGVLPGYRKTGCGRALVLHACDVYAQRGCTHMMVGTALSADTIPFYESLEFRFSHQVPEFFARHYTGSLMENGLELRDMVYFVKPLSR